MTRTDDPVLPQLPGQRVWSYPPSSRARSLAKQGIDTQPVPAYYRMLSEILTREFPIDAHFTGYSNPSVPHKLNGDAIADPNYLQTIGGAVKMVIFAADVDGPPNPDDTGHTCPDWWWASEKDKIAKLLADHPGGFVYRSNGGWRPVYKLRVPIEIRNVYEAEVLWKREYRAWAAYLVRRYGIELDDTSDWQRIFRAPHVMRVVERDDGSFDVVQQNHEIIGDPLNVGYWEPDLTAEDYAVADGKRGSAGAKKRQKDSHGNGASTSNAHGLLHRVLQNLGWLGPELEPDKWTIRCPDEHEHTTGSTFDSSTVLYGPCEGSELGYIYCSHTGHGHDSRTTKEWLQRLDQKELNRARRELREEAKTIGAISEAGTVSAPVVGDGKKLELSVSEPLAILADSSIKVLATRPVFQRSKQLVDVIRDGKSLGGIIRPQGSSQIRLLPPARLRELLEASVGFTKPTQYGVRSVRPPRDLVETIIARGEWCDIRLLRGITNWPVLRPDGTILSEPGYDAALCLLCEPDIAVDVALNPTREDALHAVEQFRSLTEEFPFVDEGHFSAWLAMLLTPFARYAIDGVVPMGIIEAAQSRTGKTLLADLNGYIVSGRELPRCPVPGDDEEWRKSMLGIASAADYCVLLDNVKGRLCSPVLEMVLTGGVFQDRVLGKNERLTVPVITMFMATSNNASISSDLINRSLLCRIDAMCERPELRTFNHDPVAYCIEHRAELVAAALTILRAYVVAGSPKVPLRPMNGFQQWSRVVRAPLVWLGLEDPAQTQELLGQFANNEDESTSDLLNAWFGAFGEQWLSSKEVISKLQEDSFSAVRRRLRNVVMAVCDCRDGKLPSPMSLGRHLIQVRGQVKDQLRLEARKKTESGIPWRVRRVGRECAAASNDVGEPEDAD